MLRDSDLVSVQEVRAKVERAWAAFERYRSYSQEQVDAIVEAVGAAGRAEAKRLAEMAVEETGYGNVPDKTAKNLLCADLLVRYVRGRRTRGVLRELPEEKVTEIGVPVGVVAAILPTTNPTSTAIYKIVIALKAGNAIVLSPHPRARKCTCYTAALLAKAAGDAGAPEGLIECVDNATIEGTQALMRHPRTAVILSTGGSGIVKAAYSSGKPAFGVGPGNVPVLLDASADIAEAVRMVVEGKSFDYGTVCSSEQSLVFAAELGDAVRRELAARKAYLCDEAETRAVEKVLLGANFSIHPECVGQSPVKIAKMAGFDAPADTTILAVEIGGAGREFPLSAEKLSPVLSLIAVKDFTAALETCETILRFGGLGHTAVIHARDEARIREFAERMPAYRILVNTPSPQGSVGITTNLAPSMTLGCGSVAGNATGDNVGPEHLMNVKRVAWAVRRAEDAFADPAAPAVGRETVVAAVEKYLAGRGLAKAPACQCDSASKPAVAPPAAAPVAVAEFVCENDVREAMREARKIYVGRRTIVTPAARDLAGASGVLVNAES